MNFKLRFDQLALLIFCLGAGKLFGNPSISDFSPLYGQPGDVITINGSGFVSGGTTVKFFNNVTDATAFVSATTQIQAHVPAGATNGPISVTVSGQTAYSPQDFTVIGVGPFVSSFNPTSGSGSVTINGAHFTGVTAVKFAGTNALTFSATSDNVMSATPPANVTTGPISITRPNGTYTTTSNYFGQASVTSFSPSSGRPGTNVVITGKNFIGTTAVRFNGTSATSFTVNSNTQISVTVPANATTGLINVVAPGGQNFSSSNFLVTPNITSFSPSFGPIGTSVTINGANLNGSAPTVKFNGVTSTGVSGVTANQLTATVPAGATTGPISVTTTDGTGSSATNFFLPPSVSGFSPTNGPIGTIVTVIGQNFSNAISVKFDGTNGTPAISFTVLSNAQISVTVPPGAATGPISVTTPGGTATSSGNFYLPPIIDNFSPSSGLGGAIVTINGTNFFAATTVSFNGASAVFTAMDNGTITATVPTNATTGPISVTAPGGTGISAANFVIETLKLSISATNNIVTVTWTTNAPGYGLQYSTNLLSTNNVWAAVTNTPQVLNGKNTVTNAVSGTKKFYRLKK